MISIAHLYSQVLFDLDDHCSPELNALKEALDDRYMVFFNSSIVSLMDKMQVLNQISFSETMKGFLYQITLNHRWPYFQKICDCYQNLVDPKQNILRGIVYTAQEFSESEKEKLEQALSPFFSNKTILLQMKKRNSLIHGLRVEIGGMCFDHSVLYHLKQFNAQVRGYGQSN